MKILHILSRNHSNSCDRMWPLISAYADGETTNSESIRVQNHISECDACSVALKEIQFTTVFLKTTRDVDPPAYLAGTILAATTQLEAKPASERLFRRQPRLQWGFGAAALAGILAAVVFNANQPPQELPIEPSRAAPSVAERVTTPRSDRPPSLHNKSGVTRKLAQSPSHHVPAVKAAIKELPAAAPRTSLSDAALPASIRISKAAPHKSSASIIALRAVVSPQPIVKMGDPMLTPQPENRPMPAIEVKPDAAAPKIDMAVMSTPVPVETPAALAEAPTPVREPAATRITFTSEARALPAGQIASLADLKKSLKQQYVPWNRQDVVRGLSGRQFSVGIVKRSF